GRARARAAAGPAGAAQPATRAMTGTAAAAMADRVRSRGPSRGRRRDVERIIWVRPIGSAAALPSAGRASRWSPIRGRPPPRPITEISPRFSVTAPAAARGRHPGRALSPRAAATQWPERTFADPESAATGDHGVDAEGGVWLALWDGGAVRPCGPRTAWLWLSYGSNRMVATITRLTPAEAGDPWGGWGFWGSRWTSRRLRAAFQRRGWASHVARAAWMAQPCRS